MTTDTPIVWQRVPQGWIELVAFEGDESAEKWWQAYLRPAGDAIDEATRATLSTAFHATRDTLRDTPYAIAGVFPYLVDDPTIFFIATTVLPAPDGPHAARVMSSFAGLVRFADDVHTEQFVALDGRQGTATLGRASLDTGAEIAAITGDVPLPGGEGHAYVLAISLDPERLDELAPYAALALDSTMLLAPDQKPPAYPAAEWLAEPAESAS